MGKLKLLVNGLNSQIYFYGEQQKGIVLKVAIGSNSPQKRYLRNEFQVLKDLYHKNVIRTLKYSENVFAPCTHIAKQLQRSNILYLQYASRGSLLDYLQSQQPEISSRRLAFKSVVEAVGYLHRQGIAHRDLKLENILVFQENGHQTFKIADFGFATHFRHNQATLKFREFKGTKKGYMAPQIHQCSKDRQKCYDAAKADVFALGVMLFALIFGQLPFQYALASDPLFKKLTRKQFTDFWSCHHSHKFQAEREYRMEEMKDLFERMVSLDPEQRPNIQQVLKNEWVYE